MIDNKDRTSDESTRSRTILMLIIYCISGTFLTLMNKVAIGIFPFTNMLLVLQNSVTVILLLFSFYLYPSSSRISPWLNMTIVRLWIPVVILFVLMLISSLFALAHVSVPTVIVIRNLSTLSVALLEYMILQRTINFVSIGNLFGMLVGAIFYAIHDFTFNIQGYFWLLVNIISTSIYQVYIKKIVDLPSVKVLGPISMSYYSNLISLPIFLLLAGVTGEFNHLLIFIRQIVTIHIRSIFIIFVSCILGFSLSTSAFALNKLISATSIMVANNVNKFALIVISEIFFQSTLDMTASLGALSVLFFGWLYTQAKERFANSLFVVAMIVFIFCYFTLEIVYTPIQFVRQTSNRTFFAKNNEQILFISNEPFNQTIATD